MAVNKLRDGRWIVHGRKGFFPGEPTKTREYFGRGEEARRQAEKRDREIHDLKPPKEPERLQSPQVFQIIKAYRTATCATTEDSTRRSSYYKLKNIIKVLGKEEASKLTHKKLDRYVKSRLTPRKIKVGDRTKLKTIKRSTVRRELADLKAALNWAVRAGHLLNNPVANYPLPKLDTEVIPPTTTTEALEIIRHAADHLKRALWISYYADLRPGLRELLDMVWSQVDFSRRVITVISARKGGVQRREVPIADDTFFKMLQSWKEADDKIGQDYLINYAKKPGEKGKPVKSIKTAWRKAKQRAGITRKLRPYDMRHAFATMVLAAGGDLNALSDMMGSAPETILKHYQHVTSALRVATISKLPSLAEAYIKIENESDPKEK